MQRAETDKHYLLNVFNMGKAETCGHNNHDHICTEIGTGARQVLPFNFNSRNEKCTHKALKNIIY